MHVVAPRNIGTQTATPAWRMPRCLSASECGAASQFGQDFAGSMKLEVLDTFKDDVNFWCTEHFFMMTGTLKLKPKA